MSTPLTDLESEALKLPLKERARLADHLLASVHADPEVDEAWAAEVQRRIAAVEAGASLVDAESVFARARQTLA